MKIDMMKQLSTYFTLFTLFLSYVSFAQIATPVEGGSVNVNVTTITETEMDDGSVVVVFPVGENQTFEVPNEVDEISYLLVGGGGGGGFATDRTAGGGAGGRVASDAFEVSPGDLITVSVGAGGSGGTGPNSPGLSGDNSILVYNGDTITVPGGGRGAQLNYSAVNGGGASHNSPSASYSPSSFSQFNGGSGGEHIIEHDCFAGPQFRMHFFAGGGAGSAGSGGNGFYNAWNNHSSGDGGSGITSSITGTTQGYGGGGGGSYQYQTHNFEHPWAEGFGSDGGGNGGTYYLKLGGNIFNCGNDRNTIVERISKMNTTNGIDGRGGGGGGGRSDWDGVTGCSSNCVQRGGDGGNGVVILRYTPKIPKLDVNEITVVENLEGSTIVVFPEGESTYTLPNNVTQIEYLVVGGGGGGGFARDRSAGGGAGGRVLEGSMSVTPGQILSIHVGAGGVYGKWGRNAESGETSSILDEDGATLAFAPGGGNGGRISDSPENGGGNYHGGGSGAAYASHEGFTSFSGGSGYDGGGIRIYSGGGGAGTSGNGLNAISSSAGNGGPGFETSITGKTIVVGGGGGGGTQVFSGYNTAKGLGTAGGGNGGFWHQSAADNTNMSWKNALDGYGGGGGGGTSDVDGDSTCDGFNNSCMQNGGNGGNGVVVLKFNNAAFEWNGSQNDDWNNTSNWSKEVVPSAGSDIHILETATHMPKVNSDLSIKNLELDAGSTLAISSGKILSVSGNILNNGNILFESDLNGSAYLNEFSGTIFGSGTFTFQQFFNDKRAFRMVTSPVNSSSIFDNWQNSGIYEPGVGTHITGEQGTVGSFNTETGIDYTLSGNHSLFEFDTDNGWQSVSNTKSTNLVAGKPYRLFIRGDRGVDLTDNLASSSTTISSAGDILYGNQTLSFPIANSANTSYMFLANPYPSRVDVSSILSNNANTLATRLWVWDPSVNERGAFVLINNIDSGEGETIPSSSATKFLEPGQAFFVELTDNSVSDITFNELDKDVETIVGVGRSVNQIIEPRIELKLNNHDGEEIDATHIEFSESFNNAIDQFDVPKLGNVDENLAIINSQKLFTVEQRNLPSFEEEIPLFTNNWRNENYSFTINLNNMPNTQVYISDAYLATQTLLNNSNTYSFTVDPNIPDSHSNTRFSLLLVSQTLDMTNQEDFNISSISPNPTSGNVLINTSLKSNSAEVKVYNNLGQVVYSKTEIIESGKINLVLNQLNSGVYFIQLKDKQGNKSINKLIINK